MQVGGGVGLIPERGAGTVCAHLVLQAGWEPEVARYGGERDPVSIVIPGVVVTPAPKVQVEREVVLEAFFDRRVARELEHDVSIAEVELV